MKYLLYTFLFALLCKIAYSQTTIDPKSISVPRYSNLATIQSSLPTPLTGTLVYNDETNTFFYYNGSAWIGFATSGSGIDTLWTKTGNFIKNTNSNGFWSEGTYNSAPVTTPVNGNGNRLMWLSESGAVRAGGINANLKAWDSDSIGKFSTAFGLNTKAKGYATTASGAYSSASGAYSTAMGMASSASGGYSTALGESSTASGNFSTAIGSNTKARGYNSIAMGFGTTASGDNSTAIGYITRANNYYSTAIGTLTTASGYGSTAMGASTTAAGEYTTAMGSSTTAAGDHSTSTGRGTTANGAASFVAGRYNVILPANPVNSNNIESTHPVFIIGNGSDDYNRRNAMVVTYEGRLGVGVNTPQNVMDINGQIRIRHNQAPAGIYINDITNQVSETQGAFIGMRTWDINAESVGIRIGDTWRFWVDRSGNGYLNGNLIQTSDRRLKKDLVPLKNSLSGLTKLNGYHFRWAEESRSQELQTGLMAQEVEKVFPELAYKDRQGFLSINYPGLIPHLIEASKELKKQNESLIQEVDALKKHLSEIEILKKRLDTIEASLNTVSTGK